MFRFLSKKKKKEFEFEIRLIDEEINRSKRHNLSLSVLVVEVSHSVPRGLSKILPGKVVSFHLLQKYIRSYDKMTGPHYRRYFIIFPQTGREGAEAVKERIYKLGQEHNWGIVSTGMAVYPEDGISPKELIEKAIDDMA